MKRQEPCRPYATVPVLAYLAGARPPVLIAEVVGRLDRWQLERLACSYAGADPEAFERWLREITTPPGTPRTVKVR